MHYFEFATEDATLYEGEATQSVNTGMDEILEVRKDMNDTASVINVSRFLIKFDLTFISQSVVDGLIPSSANGAKYYLNLYDAGSEGLPRTHTLYAYPVSQSWSVGQGTFHDDPQTTEGCSWRFRTGETTADQWVSGSNNTGGTWFSGSGYEASHSLTLDNVDVRMDVTDIVDKWLDSTIDNDGFIVKRNGWVGNLNSDLEEGNTTRYGNLKYFSRDTNTIYPPKLEVRWDDSNWSTGSLNAISGSQLDDIIVYFKNLRPEYKQNSKTKFRLNARERYPAKTYSTTAQGLVVKYLPSSSVFYEIKDSITEDVIVPYGTGSRVSCDREGHYFNLWLNGLQPERIYEIGIKVQSGSATSETFQQNYYYDSWKFKIVR